MKAGQLLSIDAGDLLPPEVAEVLAKLQSDAEPVDFEAMREGGTRRSRRREALPLRRSRRGRRLLSIGQVYRTTVDGQAVAVKIQYPGVAESIDSDLGLLKKSPKEQTLSAGRNFDDFVNEPRQVLHFRGRLSA